MWLVLVALLATADAAPPPDDPVKWAQVESRADRTFRAGWLAGFSGTVAQIAGVAFQDSRIQLGGALVQKGGVAVMLGAGFRERRAIVKRGGTVGMGWGIAGWTLWTGGGVLDVGGAWIEAELQETRPGAPLVGLDLAGVGAAIGSHMLAVGQHRHNRLAALGLGQTRAGRVHWSIRPVADRRFAGGLLSGSF
jgi:hypothetical protein